MTGSESPFESRFCEWCHVPWREWHAVRCLETADELVFCSATCLERYEDATGREQEVVQELPFPWDRGLVIASQKEWTHGRVYDRQRDGCRICGGPCAEGTCQTDRELVKRGRGEAE